MYDKTNKIIRKINNIENNNQPIGVCIVDNKFQNLYFGGIRWFTQDLILELRKTFEVYVVNLDSMIKDWPWIEYFPRKLKILIYDLIYFPWKINKICNPIKIILPYHDCRIQKSFWSITEIFVHDDSILTLSPKSLAEKAIVTYYKMRLKNQLGYKGVKFSTVSEDSAVRLKKLLGLNLRVQYNTIDERYYGKFRTEKFKAYKARINIMYSGGFHYRKNFEFACNVVRKYAELHKDKQVYFYITGEVPRESVRKVFNEKIDNLNIQETGIIQTEELVNLYRKCHVNLYPTENEGFGRVVPESILSLCIVVTQPLLLFKEIGGDSILKITPSSLSTNEWTLHINQKLESLSTMVSLDNNTQIEQLKKFRPK
jgi:glycosyltransferase involved in cell wall biosynthesis